MSIFNLTETQVDNVKHVLFGNQKQANVINDAVVKMVARDLIKLTAINTACDSEQGVITAIKGYLQDLVYNPGSTYDDNFIMLVAGEQSLANLKADGPKVVHVEQPNPESPKHTFRIHMMGDQAEVDMSAQSGNSFGFTETATTPSTSGGESYQAVNYGEESFMQRAIRIKDYLNTLCPTSIKSEVDNEWASAILAAESLNSPLADFFRANLPSAPSVDTVALCHAYDNGASLEELMSMSNLSLGQVKCILRDTGGYNIY